MPRIVTYDVMLRPIQKEDPKAISRAFMEQGWNKPQSLYESYHELQEKGLRDVIIAESKGFFLGYLTIEWSSGTPHFSKNNIPEIVDFNVLEKYQRQGVGKRLMDEAERRIKEVSPIAGIGVGLTHDYGAAQALYILRGYVPDGRGISQNDRAVEIGENITVDHGLTLHMMKVLES